jgi:hypothetical protein
MGPGRGSVSQTFTPSPGIWGGGEDQNYEKERNLLNIIM